MSLTNALRAVLALACVGCGAHAAPPRELQVHVTDEAGQPLASVPIRLDGVAAIRTRLDGAARISLAGERPAPVRVDVACPTGSVAPEPVTVARLAPEPAPDVIALSFTCRPALRTVVVVARVEGARGATLHADGEALATVAEDGTLHAVLRRPAASVVSLAIGDAAEAVSTSALVRRIRVSDGDEIVLIDQPMAGHPSQTTTHGAP